MRATLEMANADANEQSVPGVRWRRKAACKEILLTAPMIDAAAVDATAKGVLYRENLIDEGSVCDLDSEAGREVDVPGMVLPVGLPSWVSESSCFVIPTEARHFFAAP
jgi:hypothetical protein